MFNLLKPELGLTHLSHQALLMSLQPLLFFSISLFADFCFFCILSSLLTFQILEVSFQSVFSPFICLKSLRVIHDFGTLSSLESGLNWGFDLKVFVFSHQMLIFELFLLFRDSKFGWGLSSKELSNRSIRLDLEQFFLWCMEILTLALVLIHPMWQSNYQRITYSWEKFFLFLCLSCSCLTIVLNFFTSFKRSLKVEASFLAKACECADKALEVMEVVLEKWRKICRRLFNLPDFWEFLADMYLESIIYGPF